VKLRRPARPDAAPDAAMAPSGFDSAWLATRLRSLIGSLRDRQLCVAYSGGMDSTVLLTALAALRSRERFALRALHVNHQLHPQAAQWARACAANARRLRVSCDVIEVRVESGRGASLEAAARKARYQALAARLGPDELLLTAHHLEDQLETVLLALLRGSGVRGLSAMSGATAWARSLLLRPLLPVGRAQLERFARRAGLTWSEDPSNADERFDRNYLRRVVLPLLRARWPAIGASVARSAAHLAEARTLLEHMARSSLARARDGSALRVSALRCLPAPQRRNALRCWIAERGLPAPDQGRLREIAGPMLAARADAQALVRWQGAQLRRHADRLFAYSAHESHAAVAVEINQWDWRAKPWVILGAAGSLGVVRDPHGNVQLTSLPRLLTVRYRTGGERLQHLHGRVALKDLLQRQALAPWQRSAVPLIVHESRIIAVADLWLDPHFGTATGAGACERGRFRWRRNQAAT
jgi:tRNA(Ile)-lysidine synthase